MHIVAKLVGLCCHLMGVCLLRPLRHRRRPESQPVTSHRIQCPVCGNEFARQVTHSQINRHIDGCLVTRELGAHEGGEWDRLRSEALRGRWARRFGHSVNGIIVFDPSRAPTVTPNRESIADSEALARSLLYVIHDNDGQYVGSGEEITNQRYLHLRLANAQQFASIASYPFEQKKLWFYAQLNAIRVNYSTSWVVIDVARDNLLVTSFNEFRSLGVHDFHKEFKLRFAGEHAQDAGGLSREWFTLIAAQLLNPNVGLFLYSDVDNLTYQINPNSGVNENHLEYFHFAGRVIGKAIFEKQVILSPLARPLLKQLLKRPVDMEDLAFVDQQLYNSLSWILENSVSGMLYETLSVETDCFGEKKVVDLKENGRNVEVTDENKEEYVKLRVQHKIQDSIEDQINAFADGVWGVVPLPLLRIFDFQELDLLINGLPTIDVDDWRHNTTYQGDYHENHEVVTWFWEAVSKFFSQEERARLLQFSTGTSRVPAEGFRALESNRGQSARFTIQSVEWSDCAPFPRAHTCFNRLDLPKYRNQAELQKYLVGSIQMEVTGFGLDE